VSSWSLILSLLVLVLLANAAPVAARLVLGHRLERPVDGGRRLRDGRPLFGASKTWRGMVAALLATAAAAELMGLAWPIGALIGAAAMLGDLLSSFTKRRLDRPEHANVPLLDELPEALLPVAAVAVPLGLGWLDAAMVVAGFVAFHVLLDPLAERLHRRRRRP
jgi:CDP-2,3-bis-(O-geranylgeranyl)-sn-glycerol synthase